jgi:hypothetical protein
MNFSRNRRLPKHWPHLEIHQSHLQAISSILTKNSSEGPPAIGQPKENPLYAVQFHSFAPNSQRPRADILLIFRGGARQLGCACANIGCLPEVEIPRKGIDHVSLSCGRVGVPVAAQQKALYCLLRHVSVRSEGRHDY